MPTYGYECRKCKHNFDYFQSIKDEPMKICPECGGDLRRLITGGTGIIFKGKGFYVTDNGSRGGSGDAHSKPKTNGDASSSGGHSAEPKTAEPKTAEPKATEPKAPEPKTTEPKAKEPKVANS